MNFPHFLRDDGDATEQAWREDATHLLALAMAAAAPVVVLGLELQKTFILPPAVFLLPWVLVAITGATVLIRRPHYRLRATLLLGVIFAMATAQLAFSGLVGSGRLLLLAVPLLALLLLGRHAGWIAVALSALIMLAITVPAGAGILARWQVIHDNSLEPSYWLFQGLMLMCVLTPLMILFMRLLTLQTRTIRAERQARYDLQAAAATRRQLEDEIQRVGDDERDRLGTELHDGVCQQLTAALLHCTILENQLTARNLPEAASTRRLRVMLEDSIGMAYDVSKGLCPVTLEPEGLPTALQRLARQTQDTAGVACRLRSDEGVSLRDPQKALHLFRIAQEAVTNAVKHARCRTIQIELLNAADSLALLIRDDGVGPAAAAHGKNGGMGWRLMAHRAEVMGGTLTIEHPAAGGTVVICRIPLAPNMPPSP